MAGGSAKRIRFYDDGYKAPVILKRSRLAHDVIAFISGDPAFSQHVTEEQPGGTPPSAPAAGAWSYDDGMWKADWAIPDEADMASCDGGSFEQFCPRFPACLRALKLAPSPVLRFGRAVRELNGALTTEICARIQRRACKIGEVLPELGAELAEFAEDLGTALFFGSVEAQICRGDRKAMGFHYDGMTSLLHFSVALEGERSLWAVAEDLGRHVAEGSREGHPAGLTDFEFGPGDCYLSSPSGFRHGVSYRGGPAARCVMLHFRLGIRKERLRSRGKKDEVSGKSPQTAELDWKFNEMTHSVYQASSADGIWKELQNIVAEVLSEFEFQLPTLTDLERFGFRKDDLPGGELGCCCWAIGHTL